MDGENHQEVEQVLTREFFLFVGTDQTRHTALKPEKPTTKNGKRRSN